MKIVLIGAGSKQFGYGVLGEIFTSRSLKGAEIALVDINGKALSEVAATAAAFVQNKRLDFKISSTRDRCEVLANADFVIISIEVGDRFALWDIDWKIPMQYGISQVYGENGGPGGVFHSLRIVPPILDICDDVASLCPNATVFNYSNPMTSIVTTVKRRYPEMAFVGLCHEIASLERYLPSILDTPFENLQLRAAGLNHFSVVLEARYRDSGKDAYPDILARAPVFFANEPGYSELWDHTRRTGEIMETEGARERWERDEERQKNRREWSDRWLFREILERYKLLPITPDSHLGEYIAWARDVADHRGIMDFYDFYRYALAHSAYDDITLEVKERVVPVMEAIVDDTGMEEGAVNIMNDGFIPDFPAAVAVEVPAIVNSRGIRGVTFSSFPKGFGALIRNYSGVYDVLADAILEGRKDLVIQSILASPTVHLARRIPEMVDTMIDAQRDWLGYLR